jgi:hypothetical protein
MKKLLGLLLLAPGMLAAQSSFDGTWLGKTDTAKFPQKPEQYVLDKSMYRCSTCVPKIDIKADGQDQRVAGSNYFNTRSVKVVDDHTVEFTDKKDGKTIYTETDTVSSDGNTLSQKFNDESEAQPVTGELTMKRVGKGPAGSHTLSGSWRAEKIDLSKTGLTVTYQATADGLKMSDLQGNSYDAKFDGKDYPINGDPGQTMVALKKVNANTIEATYKRNGKVVGVANTTVSSDGKTMHVVFQDKERNTTTEYDLEKQS